MADSPATTLTLESLTGIQTTLALTARALPYRPVTFAGKQRVEFTWYPGSPVATAQMLGPEEQAITLRGFWKERFLAAPAQFANEAAPAALLNNVPIPTAVELTAAVDELRRTGQLYRLTWDELVRVGYITSFSQTWHNRHDCEWELEFTPISQGETVAPVGFKNLPDVASYYNETVRAVTAARDSLAIEAAPEPIAALYQPNLAGLENPTANALAIHIGQQQVSVTLRSAVSTALQTLDDNLLGAQNAVYEAAANVTAQALAGPDAARRLVAIATQAIGQAQNTYDVITNRSWDAVFNVTPFPENDISIGSQIAMRAYQRRVRTAVRDYEYQQTTQARVLLDALDPDLAAAFVAPRNMDLRDVSTEFYGTPNEWRALLVYNQLTTSRLVAGQLVWVPQRTNASASNVSGGA